MKKKFVKPSMKTIKMDLNVMQTGSGGGSSQQNTMSYGGSNKAQSGGSGGPTIAESRKATHIGYDY